MHLFGLFFLFILGAILAICVFVILTILRVVGKVRNLLNPFGKGFNTTYNTNQNRQQRTTYNQNKEGYSNASSHHFDAESGNAHHEYTGQTGNETKGKIFRKDEGTYVDFEEI